MIQQFKAYEGHCFLLSARTSNNFFLYCSLSSYFSMKQNNDKTGMGFVLHFSPHVSKRVNIFYAPTNMMISAENNAKSLIKY